MRYNETSKLIIIVYVLTLLFLGAIYVQGHIDTDPATISTLESANYSSAGSQPAELSANFQMSGETALTAAFAITLFFVFGLFMTRSKSY